VPLHALFALREDPFNLMKLAPLVPIHLQAPSRPVQVGDLHEVSFRTFGKSIWMELRIEAIDPDRRIVDVQTRGPFRHWRHEHSVAPRGEMHASLTDTVDFRFFGGAAGRALDAALVRPLLWLEFRRQHRRLHQLLERHPSLWHRARRSVRAVVRLADRR
jgi:ligand-binding SRPBCC domain-containing protein